MTCAQNLMMSLQYYLRSSGTLHVPMLAQLQTMRCHWRSPVHRHKYLWWITMTFLYIGINSFYCAILTYTPPPETNAKQANTIATNLVNGPQSQSASQSHVSTL